VAKKTIFSHAGTTLDGSSEYVSIGNNEYNFQHYSLDGISGIGISAWCWVKTSSTAAQWILGNWNNAGGDNGWGISIKATTGLLVGQLTHDEVGVEEIRVESDIAVNDGEWHLVAMSYDGTDGLSSASNMTLYVDGVPVPSTIINDTLTRVPATGTLTSTAIPNDGDTVTIGTPSLGTGYTKVYTFQTALTDVDGNVLIGASQATAMENLRRAINLDGVAGTNYATSMTIHPDISATDTATTVDVTANVPTLLPSVGNEITTTETSSVMSWGSTTLTGADNRSTSTGTIVLYQGRKGFAVLPSYFNGQVSDSGIIYRALTQSEILELWNGGVPADPTEHSFSLDINGLGGWFSGGVGGDAWDGGDAQFFGLLNGVWPSLFQKAAGFGTGLVVSTDYDYDSPYRGFLNLLSLVFDGTDDWVDFGDVHDFERTDPLSVSFWFKTSTAAIQALVAKGDVLATAGYEVSLDASGSVHFFATNTAGGTDELNVRTTATGFNDGAWHHCVLTYGGTSTPAGCHIWIDNSDEALTTVSDTLTASILNANPLRFGARSDGADRFTGNMCQVSFYDRVLTSGEVAELENSGPGDIAASSVWPSCIGWWNLGGTDTATTITDRSSLVVGGNDGTTAGTPVVAIDVPTSSTNAYNVYCRFDRVDDQYIDCGDVAAFQFDNTDVFSLECWFKIEPGVSATHFMMGKRLITGNSSGYAVFMGSGGYVGWQRINDDSPSNYASIRTVETSFDDGSWHHVVVTTDGTNAAANMAIYVDGRLRDVTLSVDTLTGSILAAVSFQIGSVNADPTNAWDGGIADVAVYDKELSPTEVLEHTNAVFDGELGSPTNRHALSTAANLVAWYPFTGCHVLGSTNTAYDFALNSFNHGTLTGTDIGLGQLYDDGPEGIKSSWRGDSGGDHTGASHTQIGADHGRGGAGGQKQAKEPVAFMDGLPEEETRIRFGLDDKDNPGGGVLPPGGGGGGITTYFQMRGVDDGTSGFTTWAVLETPDPNGAQATGGNTTPALVGSIVAGSGIVLATWQQ